MCRILKVSRSGFYAWLRRPQSDRETQNVELLERIRAVHRQNRGAYGSPRIYRALRDLGEGAGKHRIARLMRLEGLRGKAAQRFRYISTTRADDLPSAPNRLGGCFHSPAR